MVCVPCLVIPVLLWIFHKYLQPIILKFWNPWKKSIQGSTENGPPLDAEVVKSEEYQYIQKMVQENPVMVFSKTACGYTTMAKNVLNDLGVNYTVEELDTRADTTKMQDVLEKMTGARTVPRVFIGGKCIGGGSETCTLHNQGRLAVLLKEAGATFKKSD